MASLSPLTLRILTALAERDLHPYALVEQMKTDARGQYIVSDRSVYKALPRLKREGHVVASPPLRGLEVLSLTPYARRLLRHEQESLRHLSRLLSARL